MASRLLQREWALLSVGHAKPYSSYNSWSNLLIFGHNTLHRHTHRLTSAFSDLCPNVQMAALRMWCSVPIWLVSYRNCSTLSEDGQVIPVPYITRSPADAMGGRPYCPKSYKYNHAVRMWEVDAVGRQKIVIPSGIGLAAVLAVGQLSWSVKLCLSLYGKLWTVHC